MHADYPAHTRHAHDVQPFIALGKYLQANGHTVRLAAPDNFADWAGAHGLPFHGTGIAGGAGSTAAGLRAGKPTLICPLMVDQPFWGKRVFDLGCGPRPRSLRKLRADDFADRLRELIHNADYGANAERIGAAIRAEDGTRVAVELIEKAYAEHERLGT